MLVAFLARSLAAGQTHRKGGALDIHRLDDKVFFGAAPRDEADFARLRQLGVRRIIDVRTFKVRASFIERRRAAKYGISYQRIPSGFFPAVTRNVPKILSQITRVDCGGVYFHCNLGSDRVGMLVAIYRTEQFDWAPQDAWDAWKVDQFNPKLKGLDRYFWQRVGRCGCSPDR